MQKLNLANQEQFIKTEAFIFATGQMDQIVLAFQNLVADAGPGFAYLPDLESDGLLPEDFHKESEDVDHLVDYLQNQMKVTLSK